MYKFFRSRYTVMSLTLVLDEAIALVEDYDGVADQVSLLHEGGQRYPMLMTRSSAFNDLSRQEVWRSWHDLNMLPDGDYQIQGRLTDAQANQTIVGAIASPTGLERLQQLSFQVLSGESQAGKQIYIKLKPPEYNAVCKLGAISSSLKLAPVGYATIRLRLSTNR